LYSFGLPFPKIGSEREFVKWWIDWHSGKEVLLPSKARFSKRFEDAISQACESASARRVARRIGLSESTVNQWHVGDGGLGEFEMKILVTGGAGYIGSHSAKALARAGFEPIVFDNLCAGHKSAVRWGPLVSGDLADRRAIAAVLEAHSVAAVIHFAAHAYVGESIRAPRKYFQNNVVNTP
jgi:hypothetical protein